MTRVTYPEAYPIAGSVTKGAFRPSQKTFGPNVE